MPYNNWKTKSKIFFFFFNLYWHHIGISKGRLVWHSITIGFSVLQYKIIGIGAGSAYNTEKAD